MYCCISSEKAANINWRGYLTLIRYAGLCSARKEEEEAWVGGVRQALGGPSNSSSRRLMCVCVCMCVSHQLSRLQRGGGWWWVRGSLGTFYTTHRLFLWRYHLYPLLLLLHHSPVLTSLLSFAFTWLLPIACYNRVWWAMHSFSCVNLMQLLSWCS